MAHNGGYSHQSYCSRRSSGRVRKMVTAVQSPEVSDGWPPLLLFPAGVPLGRVFLQLTLSTNSPHRLNPQNVVHDDNHHASSTKVRVLERWRKMNVGQNSVWSHFYILLEQCHPGLRGAGSLNYSLRPWLHQLRTATSSPPRGCWRLDRLLDHISNCIPRKQELGCACEECHPLPSPWGPLGDFLRNAQFSPRPQFHASCFLLPP